MEKDWVLTSKDNEKVKHAAKLGASSGYRRKMGQFLMEGARLCRDAALTDIEMECCFFTRQAAVRYEEYLLPIREKAAKSFVITEEIAAKISDTQSPQGIFCICKMLDNQKKMDKMDFKGKMLALENIQDPANIGAILRTAAALGIAAVFLQDCCDVYNPKALRASMGAALKQTWAEIADMPAFLRECNKRGIHTFAAVLSDKAEDIRGVAFHGDVLAVIGNEGNGLTPETAAACKRHLIVPMRENIESLNAAVASAIIMWQMTE